MQEHIHLLQDKHWSNELVSSQEEVLVKEFDSNGHNIGYAVIRKRKINKLPYSNLRITFGPVIDFKNVEVLNETLGQLKKLAGQNRSVSIEFNPFIWDLDLKVFDSTVKKSGFKKTEDYIYKNSIIIDLQLTEDEIFKQFERRGQKAIRQSVSRGVAVNKVPVTEENFDTLYKLYKATCSRTQFIPEDYALMKKQILFWGERHKVYLFFALIDNAVVGALLLYNNGTSVSTVYQGNDYDEEVMNKRPANAMYWESLKWAKQQGFKYYDFGGITVDNKSGDPKKDGIFNFKSQFGGKIISLPGNYIYINKPVIYFLIKMVMPLYSKLALMRARRKEFESN